MFKFENHWLRIYVLGQWFSTWVNFAPRRHLAMPTEFLVIITQRGPAIGIQWVEARDIAKPTKPRTAPQQRITSPKCQ